MNILRLFAPRRQTQSARKRPAPALQVEALEGRTLLNHQPLSCAIQNVQVVVPLHVVNGRVETTLRNIGPAACTAAVAVYRKGGVELFLDRQVHFADSGPVLLPPGVPIVVGSQIPTGPTSCYQADSVTGPGPIIHPTFAGSDFYEFRLLDALHGNQCARTQGYWKNHPEAWPVRTLQLGTRTYTQAELLAIFRTPVRGNGLVSLAHQLIAAKLNVAANGAAPPPGVADAIAEADALIGSRVVPPIGNGFLSPAAVSDLVRRLTFFNETGFSFPTFSMVGP